MRYFEYKDPFLATIKAETKEDADKIYKEEVVADLDGEERVYESKELDKFSAFLKYLKVIQQSNKDKDVNEIRKEFEDEESYILLIDAYLA